jgi:hypothetical protein
MGTETGWETSQGKKKKKRQLKPRKNQYQKQYNQKAPNFQKLSHFNHDMHLSQKGLI